jgi:1-acyl-sn-glycerol-3-phosphate acyltransferase
MKIKVIEKSYEEVQKIPPCKVPAPKKPGIFFRTLLKVASGPDLKKTHFTYTTEGMEKLGKKEPCLILMNHSAFIDLEIASSILYPRPFQIVCTLDGFVGKEWLMRNLGCIPTRKFVTDMNLVKSMNYAFKTLKTSVLMYPEASYTFDGTATPLPESLAKCIKMLKIPVVMIRTYGAFLRDPLYNGLRVRNTPVSAHMSYVLSPDDIADKDSEEIAEILNSLFTFDNFKLQQESHTKITEDFRAEGLDRVLYKCPHCNSEGKTEGHGISITCTECGATYVLDEEGFLKREQDEKPAFTHIPDWYAWERECVKKELEDGTYRIDTAVDICVLRDLKAIYRVGEGRLVHTNEGFTLTGCDGKLDYKQAPLASYGLYSDYFWYELGDMISIGDDSMLYYCFPKDGFKTVAKARLAAEELYKIKKAEKAKRKYLSGAKTGQRGTSGSLNG